MKTPSLEQIKLCAELIESGEPWEFQTQHALSQTWINGANNYSPFRVIASGFIIRKKVVDLLKK